MYKFSNAFQCRRVSCVLSKFRLAVKLTVIIILATFLQVSASSYAQNISINVKNTSLSKLFKDLRRQSGYNFLYNTDVLNESTPVSLNVKDMPLKEVLDKCFAGQPLTYVIHEKNIVIQKKPAATYAAAENIVVKGVVKDTTGRPIPSVSIRVKGTTNGITSDANGAFTIKLTDGNATLVFSFVGYQSQEIAVNNRAIINVVLKEQYSSLNELIVVGYGTRKKSDITGSVSSISEKQLREIPAGNIGSILQGAAPGISVLKSGGNSYPGSTPVIRIRGGRSLGASNDPLIILDGLPFAGSLNDISPDEIVSAEILKDASATAIYGSRGSNGVILINTRRGKAGSLNITYNGYAGFNKVLGEYDVMDASQFLTFRKWAKINGSAANAYTGLDDPKLLTDIFTDPSELALYKGGGNTDWQKLLYKTALLTNHQVGVSGGTDKTQYDVSLGYYSAGGVYPGQSFDRYNAKLSIDHTLSKYIKVGLSSLTGYSILKGQNINPVNLFLEASPFSSPYNADGTLAKYLPGSNQNVWNPLADFVPGAIVDNDKRLDNFTNGYVEVNFTHGFKYRFNGGVEFSPETIGKFYGSNTTKQLGTPNYGYNSNSTGYNYTLENIITYDKTIAKDHVINFTGLYSLQKTQTENNNVSYRNVLADYIQYYNPAYASNITSGGNFTKYAILSYMGRLNYTFKDRYLATFTIRDDGSSRLAEGNKWHTFPSGALAWNMGKEDFLTGNKAISALKIRASYGTTANTAISPYQTIGGLAGVYYNYGTDNVQGTYPDPRNPGNTTLGWENTSSLNFAVDFGLLNDRITGSVEWYKQRTDDILLSQSLPATSGYQSIINNIGQTQNVGMEFNLTTINFAGNGKSSFKWTTNVNVFFNRGRINKLASGVTQDISNNWFVGSPNGVIYDYKRVGIWQNNPQDIALAQQYGLASSAAAYLTGPQSLLGTVKVADVNGDGKITAADKTILGTYQPRFEGGVTNNFAYKNFDLSVLTYFKIGGLLSSGIHNGFADSFQAGYNNLNVNYWTPGNPENYWPKPNSTLQFPTYLSTLSYFSASYLKIRTITLGYTVPGAVLSKVGAKSVRLYATASNPFTFFSPYKSQAKGLDPETNANLDVNTPALWSMLFGVNVSF
ncbi:MAG: TonB-dependent receptor plug [Mucilaginibacter sp.]|nr:TonB-dependent receptor plug [Mucilaginibacter sp.]